MAWMACMTKKLSFPVHTQCTAVSEKSAQIQWRVRALGEPWVVTRRVEVGGEERAERSVARVRGAVRAGEGAQGAHL